MSKIALIMLTLNEESRIEAALSQFRPYVDYILVLDGKSIDNTVSIASKIADRVVEHYFSGSFAEEKNFARTLVPKDCSWILYCDADEIWDKGFLTKMRELISIEESGPIPTGCFRFPRINLPNATNFPDYQVRLVINSRDILWKGILHEVLYYVPEDVPLDRLDTDGRVKKLGVYNADKYPIIHLERRKDIKRGWW